MGNQRGTVREQQTRAGVVDVARRAGVSIATVSRVLNGVGQVRTETRSRVEQAARDLDYAPNSFARSLALQKSRTIGVIVPSLRGSIFAAGVEAMQRRADEAGYSILLACSDYSLDRELALARSLTARGVDGLVLVGTDHRPELAQMLTRREVPYVCQGAICHDGAHPSVGFDNRRVMIAVTRYLLDLGHRRFAVIAGISLANDRVRDRIDGIRSALSEAGLSLDRRLLIEARYDLGEARAAMRAVLQHADRPTAVVAINDVLAHGAILECQDQGLSVPDDISVTGFDDLDFAAHVHPGITTMRVPTDLMGARAVTELLARIDGAPDPEPVVEIATELVIRGSAGPPPDARLAGDASRRERTRRLPAN